MIPPQAVETYKNTNYTAARNPNLRQPLSQSNLSQGILGVIPRKSVAGEDSNRITLPAAVYVEGQTGDSVITIPNKPAFLLIEIDITDLVEPTLDNTVFMEEYKEGSWQMIKNQDVLNLETGDAGLYCLAFTPTETQVRVNLNVASGETDSDLSAAAYVLQP